MKRLTFAGAALVAALLAFSLRVFASNPQGNMSFPQNILTPALGVGMSSTPLYGVDIAAGGLHVGALGTPTAPTLTHPSGSTGSTSRTYYVVAVDQFGNETVPSAGASFTTGPATLTSTNYIRVSIAPMAGAAQYKILKTNTSTLVATVTAATYPAATIYLDVNAVTSAYTAKTSDQTGPLVLSSGAQVTADTIVATAAQPLTLTGNAASTWSTTASNLSIDSAAQLKLGPVNATSIAVGHSGITTTVTGGFTQATGAINMTGNAASSIDSSAALSLGATTATGVAVGNTAATVTLSGLIATGQQIVPSLSGSLRNGLFFSTAAAPAIGRYYITATDAASGTGTTLLLRSGGVSTTANSGGIIMISAPGGASTGAAVGGTAGSSSVQSGNGGAGSGAFAGGDSGPITVEPGSGGAGTAAALGGNGALVRVCGGAAGATGGAGAGSPGALYLDAEGGSVNIATGAQCIGGAQAAAVNIGRAGIITTMAGTWALPTFSGLAAGTYTLGGTPTIAAPILTGSTTFARISCSGGTALGSGDIALSGGWGASATVGTISGTDAAFKFTVSTAGAGIGANPTITVTYKNGTWTTAPICLVDQSTTSDVTALTDKITYTGTATALTVTFNGTPLTANTYVFNGHCIGVN